MEVFAGLLFFLEILSEMLRIRSFAAKFESGSDFWEDNAVLAPYPIIEKKTWKRYNYIYLDFLLVVFNHPLFSVSLEHQLIPLIHYQHQLLINSSVNNQLSANGKNNEEFRINQSINSLSIPTPKYQPFSFRYSQSNRTISDL